MKKKIDVIQLLLFFSLVFLSNLGEKISIKGIRILWIAVLLSTIYLIIFFFSSLKKLISKFKYKIILFSVAWIIYATIQYMFFNYFNIIEQNNYFIVSLFFNFFLFFFILFFTETSIHTRIINYAVILSCLVNAIIALSEYILKINLISPLEHNVPGGLHGNPNDLATVIFCGIVSITIEMNKKKGVFFLFFFLFLFVFIIYISESRAVLLGTMIFFLIYIYTYMRKKFSFSLICVFFLLVAICCIFIFFFYFSLEVTESYNISGNEYSDKLRIKIILDSLKVFVSSFFLGVGAGNTTQLIGINPHNFFIEIFCDFGIIFGTGVVILFLLFLKYSKNYKHNNLSLLLLAFVFSFFIVNISSSSSFRLRPVIVIIAELIILYDNKK